MIGCLSFSPGADLFSLIWCVNVSMRLLSFISPGQATWSSQRKRILRTKIRQWDCEGKFCGKILVDVSASFCHQGDRPCKFQSSTQSCYFSLPGNMAHMYLSAYSSLEATRPCLFQSTLVNISFSRRSLLLFFVETLMMGKLLPLENLFETNKAKHLKWSFSLSNELLLCGPNKNERKCCHIQQ